jgi:hypothetical protein
MAEWSNALLSGSSLFVGASSNLASVIFCRVDESAAAADLFCYKLQANAARKAMVALLDKLADLADSVTGSSGSLGASIRFGLFACQFVNVADVSGFTSSSCHPSISRNSLLPSSSTLLLFLWWLADICTPALPFVRRTTESGCPHRLQTTINNLRISIHRVTLQPPNSVNLMGATTTSPCTCHYLESSLTCPTAEVFTGRVVPTKHLPAENAAWPWPR